MLAPVLNSFRSHLSFANVVSLIALFIALGGGAYALKVNSVGTKQLKANAVTTDKIKDEAVNGDKVVESTLGTVPSAFSAASIPAGSVRAGNLGPIVTVSDTGSAPAPLGSIGTATVQCPAGSTLLSGGGESSDVLLYTTLNRKSGDNGWRYDAVNQSTDPETVTVFALCLS